MWDGHTFNICYETNWVNNYRTNLDKQFGTKQFNQHSISPNNYKDIWQN